jgi:hypothetical protein
VHEGLFRNCRDDFALVVLGGTTPQGTLLMKTSLFRTANLAAAALTAIACFVTTPTPVALASPVEPVWNVATEPSPVGSWSAVDHGDGQWVALGHSAKVAVSPSGATWTEYPMPAGSWQSVVYGDGHFVALSSTDATTEEIVSTNGTNWTAVTGPAGSWTALTFGCLGLVVALGASVGRLT